MSAVFYRSHTPKIGSRRFPASLRDAFTMRPDGCSWPRAVNRLTSRARLRGRLDSPRQSQDPPWHQTTARHQRTQSPPIHQREPLGARYCSDSPQRAHPRDGRRTRNSIVAVGHEEEAERSMDSLAGRWRLASAAVTTSCSTSARTNGNPA